jgi:1-acyl-sn-glycerol-3-phosphate acyltransferase
MWIAVVLTPGLRRRRTVARAFLRLAMRLASVPMRVAEPSHRLTGQRVFVSNHASYLDGVALLAVLPRDVTFIAKNELERTVMLGTLLKRLGCIFVERHAVQEAAAGAGKLESALSAGRSLHVFAEGTFERAPGLLPFHMGAFRAAANHGVPLIPVAVCGTRAMLPDGTLLPRPAPVTIIVGDALVPRDASWRTAIELRRASRAFILSHVNEPDLELAPTAPQS